MGLVRPTLLSRSKSMMRHIFLVSRTRKTNLHYFTILYFYLKCYLSNDCLLLPLNGLVFEWCHMNNPSLLFWMINLSVQEEQVTQPWRLPKCRDRSLEEVCVVVFVPFLLNHDTRFLQARLTGKKLWHECIVTVMLYPSDHGAANGIK